MASCLAITEDEEIDANLFREHFNNQTRCMNFVNTSISDFLKGIDSIDRLDQMPSLLEKNQSNDFSNFLRQVREKSTNDEQYDPRSKNDHLEISNYIVDTMGGWPELSKLCSIDVTEFFLDSLYLQLKHDDSKIFENLIQNGFIDSYDQKWALLFSLTLQSTNFISK